MLGSIAIQRQIDGLRTPFADDELLRQPDDVVDVRDHPFDLVFGADRDGLQQVVDHPKDSACGRIFDRGGNHLRELCADRGHQLRHRRRRHHDCAPTPASAILSHSLQASDHGDTRYAESNNVLCPLANLEMPSSTGPKAFRPLRMTKYATVAGFIASSDMPVSSRYRRHTLSRWSPTTLGGSLPPRWMHQPKSIRGSPMCAYSQSITEMLESEPNMRFARPNSPCTKHNSTGGGRLASSHDARYRSTGIRSACLASIWRQPSI